VHARKVYVQQNEIGTVLLDQTEGIFTRTCRRYLRFRPTQAEADVDHLDNVWLIVRYENLHTGAYPQPSTNPIGLHSLRLARGTNRYILVDMREYPAKGEGPVKTGGVDLAGEISRLPRGVFTP